MLEEGLLLRVEVPEFVPVNCASLSIGTPPPAPGFSSTLIRRMSRIYIYITFVAIAQKERHVYVTNKVIARGRMPHIRYMQNARHFTELFSNIPAFRQVLRVPQPISFYLSTFNYG